MYIIMLSRFVRFACCHASVNDLKLLKILVVLVFAGFYFFFFFKYFVTRSISLIRRSCFVSCYHELNSDINITRYYMVIYVHRNNDYTISILLFPKTGYADWKTLAWNVRWKGNRILQQFRRNEIQGKVGSCTKFLIPKQNFRDTRIFRKL